MRLGSYAGQPIAADRNDREMWAYHRRLLEQGRRPITTAPVVAQVSRGPRQAMLHRLLGACRVVGVDSSGFRQTYGFGEIRRTVGK